MTDSKSPGDRLLELVVYGPAGLAVTVAEEFPKLVEKGRHRVEGQVHTARLVGQFAVQMGRRQIEQSFAHLGGSRAAPAAAPTAEHVEADPVPPAPEAGAPTPPQVPIPPFADRRRPVETTWQRPAWTAGEAGNGSASPSSLAIPGYDSLSASQVVQRLEGLSASELEEVRAHEAAHRQRRTILHRVEQLLAGADGAQP